MALTKKQQLFVREYLIDCNASQAAIRAGYKNRPNTAAYQIMSNNVVKEEINRLMSEKTKELDYSREAILEGLAREAQLANEDGGSSSTRIQAYSQLGRLTMGELARQEQSGTLEVQWLDNVEEKEEENTQAIDNKEVSTGK